MRLLVALAFAVVAAGLAGEAWSAGEAEADDPHALLASGDLASAQRAAEILEARAARAPQSFEARFDAARALTQLMAIRSNGNLPLVDGLQDTDANRALWADLGKRALEHARAAHEMQPRSAAASATLATSYMFYASSLGIVQSILKGAGDEYRTHAQRLVDLDPKFDDALGDTLLASFYLVAPWPVGDEEASLQHYERAATLAPRSVRVQYGLAVYWARNGDTARARRHFERVVELPCTANTERLFCGWMKATAKSELATLAQN